MANILLINALVDPDTTEDVDQRVTLRSQLYQGGLNRVLDKMNTLNNELLARKIKEFHQFEERDKATIYGGLVSGNQEPGDILDKLITATNGTRAYRSLQCILQQLLLLQQDPSKR